MKRILTVMSTALLVTATGLAIGPAGTGFGQVARAANLPAPSDFRCTPNGVGSFQLLFDRPSDPPGDPTSIEIRDYTSKTWSISADNLSFAYDIEANLTGLNPNQQYVLQVREKFPSGFTDWSEFCSPAYPRPEKGNLVLNPSVESGLSYWQSLNGTLARASGGSPGRGGTWSVRVSRRSGSLYNLSDSAVAGTMPSVVDAHPGAYMAAAWVKAASPSAVGKPVVIGLRERNASGAIIHDGVSAAKKLTKQWQQIWVTSPVASPGDPIGVRVEQRSATAGNAMLVDDVRVHAVGTVVAVGQPAQALNVVTPNVKRVTPATFGVCSYNSPYSFEPCDYEYDITSFAAYVDGKAGGKGSAPIRAVVYALRPGVGYSSAVPTTLVAASAQKTVTAGQAPGWVNLPLSQPLEVRTFENYWFGIQVGGTTKIVRIYGNNDGSSTYDSGQGDYAPASAYNSDLYSDGPAKSFGAFHDGTMGTMVSGAGGI